MTMRELPDAAERLRNADHSGRGRAREALARAIRLAALQELARWRLDPAAREDLAHGVVLKVLGCIERGDATQGREAGLCRTATRNCAADYLRRVRSRNETSYHDLPSSPGAIPNPEQVALAVEDHSLLLDAIAASPEQYRGVIRSDLGDGSSTAAPSATEVDRRARNRGHQLRCRAHRWVRRHIAQAE